MGWVRRLTKGRLQILDVPQVFSSSMSAYLHRQVLWEGSTFMHLHLLGEPLGAQTTYYLCRYT